MITKFEFIDHVHNWTLEEVNFSEFNLLVGLSGAGKTQILNALSMVCNVGLDNFHANGCQWTLSLQIEDDHYLWTAETSTVQGILDDPEKDDRKQATEEPHFLQEEIICNDKILVERTPETFYFNEHPLPRLKNTESAVSLLSNEESIRSIYQALNRTIFFGEDAIERFLPFDETFFNFFNRVRNRYPNLDNLQKATDVPLVVKTYLLQTDYPEFYQKIKDDYMAIFETIEDIKLQRLSNVYPLILHEAPPIATDLLVLAVKEKGVNDWIIGPRLSSGMLRTFTHLLDLAMAAPGSAIVIDDFENSLGVNCLPALVDHFLSRSRDIQFILTSHHPYVINNVPMKRWKVVTRQGSQVKVLAQSEIPALNTDSKQDQFVLLMNLEAYEEGIR